MKATILVVASQTASSEELLSHLHTRAETTPIRLEFVVPASGNEASCREEAQRRLDDALERVREAGFEATGHVGDCDVLEAVLEVYDPKRHDEILVSTLPASISRWLGIGLPARISRATNALVSQVSESESRAALH